MIVLTLTDCPPRLRGDLSKWLCEINTGVYVGTVSARVREALWNRVCDNLKNGRATLVYTASGEQRMTFRVHNSAWTPVDFDGITLMRRPLPRAQKAEEEEDEPLQLGFSKAARYQMARKHAASAQRQAKERYVVLDLETTGLRPDQDAIVEYGALRVEDGEITASFAQLVRCGQALPPDIVKLTGISDDLLREQGAEPEQALDGFLQFLGKDKLMGYNLAFDLDFLRAACRKYGRPFPANPSADLLRLARRKVYGVANYKLETLVQHFALQSPTRHRALADCEQAWQLYVKLNEIP